MGDRGVIHVQDHYSGATLATFYSHNGGSAVYMLAKLADWALANPEGTTADLVKHMLGTPDLHLELHPAGDEPGDLDHVYTVTVQPKRWDAERVGLVTTERHAHWGIDGGRTWDPTLLRTGDDAVLIAATEECQKAADHLAGYMRQRGLTEDAARSIGAHPGPFREQADAFREAFASRIVAETFATA